MSKAQLCIVSLVLVLAHREVKDAETEVEVNVGASRKSASVYVVFAREGLEDVHIRQTHCDILKGERWRKTRRC